jgi:hypothetical protein
MSEEHLLGISPWGQLNEPPKRRRTPSQYATQIADFKNVPLSLFRILLPTPKRQKASDLLNPTKFPKKIAAPHRPSPSSASSPTAKATLLKSCLRPINQIALKKVRGGN